MSHGGRKEERVADAIVSDVAKYLYFCDSNKFGWHHLTCSDNIHRLVFLLDKISRLYNNDNRNSCLARSQEYYSAHREERIVNITRHMQKNTGLPVVSTTPTEMSSRLLVVSTTRFTKMSSIYLRSLTLLFTSLTNYVDLVLYIV